MFNRLFIEKKMISLEHTDTKYLILPLYSYNLEEAAEKIKLKFFQLVFKFTLQTPKSLPPVSCLLTPANTMITALSNNIAPPF